MPVGSTQAGEISLFVGMLVSDREPVRHGDEQRRYRQHEDHRQHVLGSLAHGVTGVKNGVMIGASAAQSSSTKAMMADQLIVVALAVLRVV